MTTRNSDTTPSLRRQGDDSYLDQNGVTWMSPAQWLFCGILGGCGCGSSDAFADEAVRLLRDFSSQQRTVSVYADRFHELLAHWFDHAGLIEHGTSIAYPWLSPRGKAVLAALAADDETKG